MARPKRIDCSREDAAVEEAKGRCGIDDVGFNGINLYCYNIMLPLEVGDEKAAEFANCVFHALDVLDEGVNVGIGEGSDFCELVRDDEMECYCVVFNHHLVVEDDDLYEYSVEALRSEEGEDGEGEDDDEPSPEQVMEFVADAIKSGEFRSKSGEGYFVLKGEYFDAIEAGRKTTEYRDLSPHNLSHSIGIKTVKLQRGYGHAGKPPKQMRFEVKSVRLMDTSNRECDPFAIPSGFLATTIAIHLGKRIS